MKYSLIVCVNGNFNIEGEYSNQNSAFVGFHGKCQALWNASDVITAAVIVVDENLQKVGGKYELIDKTPAAAE